MALYTMHTPTSFLLLLTAGHFVVAADFRGTMHQGQEALARADYPAAERFFLAACDEQSLWSFTPDMQASCEHHLAIIDEVRGDYSLAAARLARALIFWDQAGARFRGSWVMSSEFAHPVWPTSIV